MHSRKSPLASIPPKLKSLSIHRGLVLAPAPHPQPLQIFQSMDAQVLDINGLEQWLYSIFPIHEFPTVDIKYCFQSWMWNPGLERADCIFIGENPCINEPCINSNCKRQKKLCFYLYILYFYVHTHLFLCIYFMYTLISKKSVFHGMPPLPRIVFLAIH